MQDNTHADIQQDLYDIRTVLLKQTRPNAVDVERELRCFKAKHHPRTSHKLSRRHTALLVSLFAAAAVLLALFLLRPHIAGQSRIRENAMPQKLAMTTAAKHARYATISNRQP